MARTENVELTVLCLVFEGERILLQNRVKNDWRGYALPGGHVEPGESIVDAVVREMKEETGLTVRNPKLCGIKQFPIDGGRYLVFLFKTGEYSGELSSSQEGTVQWVQRCALPQMETVADLQELLSVFDREDLTEFQYIRAGDQWDVSLR